MTEFDNPMQPIGSGYGFMYYGGREGWLIAYGYSEVVSTAEQCMDQSNIAEMLAQFQAVDPDGDDHAVETFGGAFGRGGYLLVRGGSECERIAIDLRARLADYPVLNEDDWSEREWDAGYSTIMDWAQSEYPGIDAETLASAFIEACQYSGANDFCDRWPDRDGIDRDAIAKALWKSRHAHAA